MLLYAPIGLCVILLECVYSLRACRWEAVSGQKLWVDCACSSAWCVHARRGMGL